MLTVHQCVEGRLVVGCAKRVSRRVISAIEVTKGPPFTVMSVEQPAEDPSTLSTPASDKLVVEKESMHTSASSSSISSASLPSDRAAEVEGPKPPAVEEIVAGLRDWVATLSLKERAVAMSFTDSVLLSAMVGHRLSHPAPPVGEYQFLRAIRHGPRTTLKNEQDLG